MRLTSPQFGSGGEGDYLPANPTPATPIAPTGDSPIIAAQPKVKSTAPVKAAPTKAIDKSNWNRDIKVRQSTIDELKKGGIKSAAAMSKVNAGADQSGLVGEYQEATKRLYPKAYTASPSKVTKPAPKVDNTQVPNTPYPFGGFTQSPNKPKSVAKTGSKVDNTQVPNTPYGFGGFTQSPNKSTPKPKPKPTLNTRFGVNN